MNDERIMKTMMDALPDLPTPGPNYTQGFVKHLAAIEILAALRAAGFDVYRPDDSGHWWITTGVETEQGRKVVGPFSTKDDCFVARTYIEKVEGHSNYWIERLVPVGGEG